MKFIEFNILQKNMMLQIV